MAIGAAAKMAGSPGFREALGKLLFGGMTKGQIATRLAPDALFGVMAGAMTPGDITDKLLAGSTQAIGGGLGGLALGRAAGGLGEGVATAADFAGSIAGDYGGMFVGDALQRGKDKLMGGEGLTAFERAGAEQQRLLEAQIRQQTLMELGLM